MKGFSSILTLGALAAATLIAGPRAGAQQFELSVTPSSDSILVSNLLTYTINVTNSGGGLLNTFVTNALSASAQLQSLQYSQGTYSTNTNNVVVFELGSFSAGYAAQLIVTVEPTAVGLITNFVTVAYPAGMAEAVSTNVVVDVTNVPPTLADLGVTMTGPKQVVITNDWMTYGVTVTNAGPSAASNVMLTNVVPPGVIGISSPKQNSGTNSPISLGTLVSGGSVNLQFTVEPTNAGVLPFSASVGSGTEDPNTANNFASTNITITNYLSDTLIAVTNTAQSTNFVLGLLEQTITVSNAGPLSAPAVRIIVTGLTNRSLFNAVGTNDINPFVYYSTALPTNQSVNLVLQYFPRKSFPFTNSQLRAFAMPAAPDWTPPPAILGTNVIGRILRLSNGNMFIDWPSTIGKTYTVVYSDNVAFSNAMIAPPSIVAPATDTGWIDYGPPTTVSAPPNSTNRFYRVYLNP